MAAPEEIDRTDRSPSQRLAPGGTVTGSRRSSVRVDVSDV